MPSRPSVLLLLSQTVLAGSLVGCQPTPPQPKPLPPPPATAQQVSQIKQEFQQYDPSIHVGTVAGVRSSDLLLAVSGISVTEVKEGDAITITDSARNAIAIGTVQALTKTDQFLIVKYETQPGKRAPEVNDVALRFTTK